MTQHILLATDLSANAAFAARWAKHYADAVGAKVILAHIIEINVPNWVRDAYNVLEEEDKRVKLEERITEWYRTHAKGEHDGILIEAGNIDQQLGEFAEQIDASMIVIAKSGKSALTRFLAGSTAQMLAANPPRPVVIVHPDHTKLDSTTKIAVATDLTETAEKAIATAARLSGALGSHLDIVHASAIGGSSVDISELPEELSPENLEKKTKEQLDSVISKHSHELEEIDSSAHIINAAPVEAISQFAQDNHTDIVFVGNASHYNVITNVFGRVSVKLMQTLDCTFIVFPPHSALDEDSSEEE